MVVQQVTGHVFVFFFLVGNHFEGSDSPLLLVKLYSYHVDEIARRKLKFLGRELFDVRGWKKIWSLLLIRVMGFNEAQSSLTFENLQSNNTDLLLIFKNGSIIKGQHSLSTEPLSS